MPFMIASLIAVSSISAAPDSAAAKKSLKLE
jgi:hypothetical protein